MSKLLKSKILLGVMIVAVLFVGAFALSLNSAKADCTVTAFLKQTMKGAEVSCLQAKLDVTPATGYFGSITKAKVMAFQASKGLTADGLVGAATRAALNATSAVVPATDLCPNGMTLASNCTTLPGTVTPPALCPNGMTLASNCTTLPGTVTPPSNTAGDVNLTSTTTDVETQVVEGATTKVLGFKAEASGSDVSITNLKVSLKNRNVSTASYRLTNVASEVAVWMGSNKVGSALVADFSKDTTTAGGVNVYSKSISLTGATVKMGTLNKQTFYVTVTALPNIDSTDMTSDNWAILVDNVRFQDGTGVVMTSGTDIGSITTGRFEFTDLATSGDVKVVVSKGSGSPIAQNVLVSTTSSTKDVPLLEFKVKTTGSTASFDSVNITTTLTTAGADTWTSAIGQLTLKDGAGNELATIDGSDIVTGANTFTLDTTKVIAADTTETFHVYATVNKGIVANFTSGFAIGASFASFSPEDMNGGIITDTGSATGSVQTMVYSVPTIALSGTPTLALLTHTDGTTTGLEDTYRATINYTVTAPESAAVYVPKDDFAYGTAGTAGVLYTVTNNPTITSAYTQFAAGTTGVEGMTESASYRVDAGTSQTFTLTVNLVGNDLSSKVTMTGLWYELSNTTPNNSPLVSGLTNLYTPLLTLSK